MKKIFDIVIHYESGPYRNITFVSFAKNKCCAIKDAMSFIKKIRKEMNATDFSGISINVLENEDE